jgi:hypothetical protein
MQADKGQPSLHNFFPVPSMWQRILLVAGQPGRAFVPVQNLPFRVHKIHAIAHLAQQLFIKIRRKLKLKHPFLPRYVRCVLSTPSNHEFLGLLQMYHPSISRRE